MVWKEYRYYGIYIIELFSNGLVQFLCCQRRKLIYGYVHDINFRIREIL